MDYSPVVNRVCQYCGKYVPLYEHDFTATIGKNGKVHYFFECPNCQEFDKIDEKHLPGYLKDKLVAKARQNEDDDKIYIYIVSAIAFAIALYLVKF